jgi:hypothetical protein
MMQFEVCFLLPYISLTKDGGDRKSPYNPIVISRTSQQVYAGLRQSGRNCILDFNLLRSDGSYPLERRYTGNNANTAEIAIWNMYE